MSQEIDYVSDLNDKYAALEIELDQQLTTIVKTDKLFEADQMLVNKDVDKKAARSVSSLDASRRRNYELLKSLEMSKARLRSRATFSPLETILQKAIGNYLKETSLVPCSTKRAYGPTYV
ncbi:uncharacterized protein LOC131282592 [Anopheles ziemanni]|uniref:uncharacterized protein LOC131266032 n=1 Tax=Anopheles coustani TaxID=139045 RepID=UPI002659809E|nr:uncharacterized protein LOC131266032 [Anopheles coustani]XP_058168080.1 uncharacterized protein LOC131282592 [Anopheles ziemanni]